MFAMQRGVNYLMMWTGSPWEWGEWEIRQMSRRNQRQQCNVNNELLKLCPEKNFWITIARKARSMAWAAPPSPSKAAAKEGK